jgi:hypothetical protein
MVMVGPIAEITMAMAFQIGGTDVRTTPTATEQVRSVNSHHPHQEISMNTLSLRKTTVSQPPTWITEEYHGKQIHVCTEHCAVENEALSGHGQQWAFTVRVTDKDAGLMAEQYAGAKSDPGLFYSTQAIAEEMGFIRGRKLIEA